MTLLACLQAVTGGFIAENPLSSLNRAPSWIFEARAPGYERVAQKSREGEGEVFRPSPRPRPLAHFVNTLPGPDLAARTQDGDLITNSGFFFRPSNRLRAGYDSPSVICNPRGLFTYKEKIPWPFKRVLTHVKTVFNQR